MEYKEGDSPWIDVFKQSGVDVAQPTSGFKGSEAPSLEKGATHMQHIPGASGVKVSKASGSWAYIIQTESASYIIPTILDFMKKAAQPLLDNNLIDYYEIVERKTGKQVEVKYSKEGKEKEDAWMDEYSACISNMKFLADKFLNPEAAKIVYKTLDIGPDERKIGPKEIKVPWDKLQNFVKNYRSEDAFLNLFLFALKSFDKQKLKAIEKLIEHAKQLDVEYAGTGKDPKYGPYYIGGMSNALLSLWDENWEARDIINSYLRPDRDEDSLLSDIVYGAGTISDVLTYTPFLKTVAPREVKELIDDVSPLVENRIQRTFGGWSMKEVEEYFLENRGEYGWGQLIDIKDFLDLSPESKRILEAMDKGRKKRWEEVSKQRRKSRKKRR